MTRTQKLIQFYYRKRASWYRWNRILFPSPAEVRFVQLMGGKYWQVSWLKHRRTKLPFTIFYSYGKILSEECFGRERRVGKYFVDFGNDLSMGIEIDGRQWHRDIVAEMDREIYFNVRGWRVIHIEAVHLWNRPNEVQQRVLKFLYR
ncbi:MAG TPA: DUF559 domain-containing protein [Candidatus Saccharibacteria bacterium]|nr:DUF559 domain-containing protein [Candidatus Saccharibacteria bacterium]